MVRYSSDFFLDICFVYTQSSDAMGLIMHGVISLFIVFINADRINFHLFKIDLFNVNFEQISHNVLEFKLLALNK